MYSDARLNDLANDPTFAGDVRSLAAALASHPAVRPRNHVLALLRYGPDRSGTALRLLRPHVWLDVDRLDVELFGRLASLAARVETTRD